jgi:hypothetical protein
MKESVAIAKEADTMTSPTKSEKSIHRAQHEPERQLGSLRDVIGNIRRNDGTPSVDSIATELSSMPSTTQRASVLLALQRTHGNRYVQRVVSGIQAKFKVGQPGDIYEQEADRMADAVMRMTEPEVQRQSEVEEEEDGREKLSIQARTITPTQALTLQRQDDEEEEELKKKKKEEEKEETLHAKEPPGHVPEVTPEFESRIHALQGGGQPLSESARAFFEPRFGQDFSRVRAHTDAQAAETAQTLNARAFTMGHDIVFGAGQYVPGTSEGRRLMAHELTHVVQQGLSSSVTKIQRVVEGDITQMSITEDWAIKLNDDELEEQINIVRNQLLTLDLTTPESDADRLNLRILEAEAARRLFPLTTTEVSQLGEATIGTYGRKEFSIRLDVFPEEPIDPAEVLLGVFAKGREKRGETAAAISIKELDDIFILLEVISEKISKNTGSKKVEPFLSELHILGHGAPGRFGIGTYMYDPDDLKKIKTGKTQGYIKTNATIYLEGCDVASGSKGEEFMYQMGRIFFGSKSGYVWGNTCPVLGAVVEITTCKPVKKKYPADFKKK